MSSTIKASAGSGRPAAEIVSLNPSTLEELARFPVASATDVAAAVSRARTAQPVWGSLSYRNRARYLLKARRVLYDRQDELIQLISKETGKPPFEALATEVFPLADLISHYASATHRILRDRRFTLAVFRNKRSMI
ncbi:MAG TPA: aldehyde dehydrogenase family protein, partial [Blastocatellia bacterium]